jgi:hypothetical protein
LDFGADASGTKDATEPVRKAIASLAKENGRLVFPAGKYRFAASDDIAMQFAGFRGIEIYANNAELLFAGATQPFSFRDCRDVAVHDIRLDWERPIFSKSRARACFLVEDCQGILFEDVVVKRTPATAFLLHGCRDLHMDGVTVADFAKNDDSGVHAISAGGDGLHCSDCRGNLLLKDLQFQGIGGDAINIYQTYWRITARLDDRSVLIAREGERQVEAWELPQPGDFVQFSSPASLQLLGEIGIASAELQPSAHAPGIRLSFPETLSPVIVPGTLVCSVVDAPRIGLDHATIANVAGRGLMMHTRGEITNNHFKGCADEAILLAPDLLAMQGPAVQNVRIRGNTFEDCNHGSPDGGRGIISVDTHQQAARVQEKAGVSDASLFPLNSGISIQGNTFIRSSTAAIYAASVDDLVVRENVLGHAPLAHAGSAPVAIVLRNVANAEVSNNISNVPQTIAMTDCADTVQAEGNRMLTTSKMS